jgi:hypothetical protein
MTSGAWDVAAREIRFGDKHFLVRGLTALAAKGGCLAFRDSFVTMAVVFNSAIRLARTLAPLSGGVHLRWSRAVNTLSDELFP